MWCKNPECGDEFYPVENSAGTFCSYECEDEFDAIAEREQNTSDYELSFGRKL